MAFPFVPRVSVPVATLVSRTKVMASKSGSLHESVIFNVVSSFVI